MNIFCCKVLLILAISAPLWSCSDPKEEAKESALRESVRSTQQLVDSLKKQNSLAHKQIDSLDIPK